MALIEGTTTTTASSAKRRRGSRSRGRTIQKGRRKRETYKVKKGDNWFSIARKKNRKARQLARANRGVETVRPGQVISIPDVEAPRPPQPNEERQAGARYDIGAVQAGRPQDWSEVRDRAQSAPAVNIDWDAAQEAVRSYDVQGIQTGGQRLETEYDRPYTTGALLEPAQSTFLQNTFGVPEGESSFLRTVMPTLFEEYQSPEYAEAAEAGLDLAGRATEFARNVGRGMTGRPARVQTGIPVRDMFAGVESGGLGTPTAIGGVPAGEVDTPERAARVIESKRGLVITTMIDNGQMPTRLSISDMALLGMDDPDEIEAWAEASGYTWDGEYWVRSAYSNVAEPNGRGDYTGYASSGGYGYGYGGRGGGGGGGGQNRMVGGRGGGTGSPLPPGVFGLVSWSGL